MTTTTIRVLICPERGPVLPVEGMALLLGVPAEDVRAHAATNGTDLTTMSLPSEWVQSGRRRTKEAQAHGHDDMLSGLRYWANRDHGAELVIEYAGVDR